MLTVKEAAARARASPSLIYELCRTGRLGHYRVGCRGRGKILIDPKSFDDYLAACRVEASPAGDEEGLKFIKL